MVYVGEWLRTALLVIGSDRASLLVVSRELGCGVIVSGLGGRHDLPRQSFGMFATGELSVNVDWKNFQKDQDSKACEAGFILYYSRYTFTLTKEHSRHFTRDVSE